MPHLPVAFGPTYHKQETGMAAGYVPGLFVVPSGGLGSLLKRGKGYTTCAFAALYACPIDHAPLRASALLLPRAS